MSIINEKLIGQDKDVIKKVNVAGAVIKKTDEEGNDYVLLIQRDADDHWPLIWEFPRGKCDKGDSKDIEKLKEDIDKMTHQELASLWRFGKSENKYLQGEAGEYLKDRLFNHFGGFNPKLSKDIGW